VAGSAGEANTAGAAGSAGSAGQAGAGEAGSAGAGSESDELHLYVGCSVPEGTLQIYRVSNGTFNALPSASTTGNISNATFNQAEDKLYVAHAVGTGPAARVTTFARDRSTGALSQIGVSAEVPSITPSFGGAGGGGGSGGTGGTGGAGGTGGTAGTGGAGATNPLPQTLTFDATESHVAVPNYGTGNVYVYDILSDGSLGSIVSADAGGTNAHHAVFSNNQHFMLVPYLGSNLIKVYAYTASSGNITLGSTVNMPNASTGPRHLALHSNGTWLYSINETAGGAASESGSIDFFTFDQSNGDLTPKQTFPVPLPSGYTGLKMGAEIEIAPSGKFLYVSMRLDSAAPGSLVVFSIDANGGLTFVEQQSSRGLTPRQFSLSKDGKLLIVGNQGSATIELFSVDTVSGKLTFVAEQAVCTSPRFSRFAQIR
jgi:6-phosphogluconolactonase